MKKSYDGICYCFLILAMVFLCGCKSELTGTQKNEDTPKGWNILIIMADDLDSRQLSCYGGKNMQTPNIDALASGGMKFNNIFCSEAMCVPARASLFTGLYPVRHGSFQNHKKAYPGVKSIAHYLRAEGYRVGLTGKDHSTTPRTVFPFDIIQGFENNCVSKTDDYFMDSVRRYVSNREKPFCLFIMSINPHAPWTVGDPSEFDPDSVQLPPNFVDTELTRKDFCNYLAEIRQLDDQVGDIMKMLKDTGRDKNTIVIFLGEQGPQFPGGKWTNWDYGLRSSMIVKWEGIVSPNSETNALIQYEDITPTVIDIAGGDRVANLDGNSFLSVLKGDTDTFRDYAFGIHNNIPAGTAYPIRSVWDGQYKFIMNLSPDKEYYVRAMMNPRKTNSYWTTWLEASQSGEHAKWITERVLHRPALEFYDVRKDPFELNNMVENPEYQTIITGLSDHLKRWMKEQGDLGVEMDKKFPDPPQNTKID